MGEEAGENPTRPARSMGKYITKSLILFLFPEEYIDIWWGHVIMNPISIGKSLSKARYYRPPDSPAKAIRTAGSNAENREKRLATSVALLIELKAQFYKLVTINRMCLRGMNL